MCSCSLLRSRCRLGTCCAMTDAGYAKILQQQKEIQAQAGRMHTHLQANSRVTSVILPIVFVGGGLVALTSSMYRLYTGAHDPFCTFLAHRVATTQLMEIAC